VVTWGKKETNTKLEQNKYYNCSENYLAKQGANNNFLLMHSVGSIPHGVEIDVPLIYADYYFLEALLRWQNMNKKKS
jgi:chondroitin AC lyase